MIKITKNLFIVLYLLFFLNLFVGNSYNKNMLYPVTIKNKSGYIDKNGKIIIPPIYEEAFSFKEGLSLIKKNGRYGFIDLNGKIVIKPIYKYALDFSEGLAAVYGENNHWGFIDKEGNLQIDYRFTDDGFFSEGLAPVCLEYFFGKGLCRTVYIDKLGKIVLEIKHKTAEYMNLRHFSNGLALVCSKSGKCGYINKKGEMVIPQEYNSASDFSEGLAAVSKSGKYGYINIKNKIVIPEQFDDAKNFSEGLAAVGKGDLYGYINKRGKLVIPYKFIYAKEFLYGLAYVKEKEGKEIYEGYIDKKGKYVWKQKVEE